MGRRVSAASRLAPARAPVTIRLGALVGEHLLPLLVDLLVALACYAVLLAVGAADGGLLILPFLAVAVFVHLIQLRWLVALRFDDAGLEIIRPWRRRTTGWERIAGLIYVAQPNTMPGTSLWYLRLVLEGDEPPLDRFVTDAELAGHAHGPVVMTLGHLDGDSPACAAAVYAELERRGLRRPEPRPLAYSSRRYTQAQVRLAAALDVRRAAGVTVEHPPGAEPCEAVEAAAREHGAEPSTVRRRDYEVYLFDGDGAQQRADAFAAAARAVLPAQWSLRPGALPAPLTPDVE